METIERNYKKRTYTFVFDIPDTTQEAEILAYRGLHGEVVKLIVILPAWTDGVTATITMINEDEKEIFKSSALPGNDEYDITLAYNECIIMGDSGEKWVMTLSDATVTGGESTITAYIEA